MSVTLLKTRRILQQGGLKALVTRGFSQGVNLLKVIFFLSGRPRFESVETLLERSFTACAGITPFQVRTEIRQLLELMRQRTIRTVLEIGTANGGTLFLFTRAAAPDALIISVDLPGGRFGDGYARWRSPIYRLFAMDDQVIHLCRADSHSASTLEMVRKILGKRSLDFLFIDGDHTYEGVKRDFEMYGSLVKRGGLIALHDIAAHEKSWGCEVDRFWRELQGNYQVQEFIENREQGWAGIGVLEMR